MNEHPLWRLRREDDLSEDLWEGGWKILERIGTYAAGELSGEEAREVERLEFEDPTKQHLAESYRRMLDLLRAVAEKPPEVPKVVIDHAIERAAVENSSAEHTRQDDAD